MSFFVFLVVLALFGVLSSAGITTIDFDDIKIRSNLGALGAIPESYYGLTFTYFQAMNCTQIRAIEDSHDFPVQNEGACSSPPNAAVDVLGGQRSGPSRFQTMGKTFELLSMTLQPLYRVSQPEFTISILASGPGGFFQEQLSFGPNDTKPAKFEPGLVPGVAWTGLTQVNVSSKSTLLDKAWIFFMDDL
jgi:hypothetical protein